MRSLLVGFTLTVLGITAPTLAAQRVEMSIDASKAGAKIDRNIFGQFAEHLGHAFTKASGSGPIPRSRTRVGFATML
jgi:alpha-L-arabinofuranosidase